MNATRSEIMLIGPIGAGKSTLGRLLAARLERPRRSLDDLRWAYYAEIGYDPAAADAIEAKEGFAGKYRYWKPFEIHALERFVAESENYVADLGAGHSVYEDPVYFARAQRALAPFRNVVLLLPSSDLDESVRILRERTQIPSGGDVDFVEHFVKHHSNHDLATHVVYTEGKTPEETAEEIERGLVLGSTREDIRCQGQPSP